MSIYKQIALITLFIVIQLLFIFPHQNNTFIITLKGISSAGLLAIISSYAFPSLLKARKKLNGLQSLNDNSKKPKESPFIDQRYSALLENIKNGILSINKSYVCGLYIIEPVSEVFKLKSSSEEIFKDSIKLDNPLLSSVLDSNLPKTLKYKDINPENWNELIGYEKWKGSESAFCFPVKNGNNTIGALFVFVDHFSKISSQDIEVINSFIEILNQGIFDIGKSESQYLKSKNSSLIHDLFKDFDPETDSDAFFKSVKNTCRSIFKYDKLTISFKSSEKEELKVLLTDGFDEDVIDGFSFNPRNSIVGLSYIDNNIVNLTDWKNQFPEMNRFDDTFESPEYFSAVLSSPLRASGKSIGSITLERIGKKSFTSIDTDMLKLLSENASKILGWMDIHHQLNRSASRDGLTGLLNHKTFLNRFAKEIDRSSRFGEQLGLIFFDIDKFKSVNDTYGHLYGDYVLEEVSQIISKNVRSIDIVGRYGGEEFAVLLVNTDINACKPLAEKIVKKIAKKTYLKDGIAVNLTISAGMSGFPTHSENIESLIAKADKAMYATKGNGGNGVTIAK